jgi:trimeric autotransporter adhesin
MATTLFNKTALANGTSNLTVRADALNQSTDLVQAGVVFNDALRASTGLFSLSGSGNQNPFLSSYTTDIHAVQNDIAAMLATPAAVTLGGQAFTLNTTDIANLTNVESQLGTLLTAAPQTTSPATMTAADQTLHAVQNEILQEINNDPHIASALNNVQFMANTGANDVAFQNTPAGADDPAALAAATAGTSLKAVGEVFNAVTDLSLGGISAANLGQVTTDLTAVEQGVTSILNNPTLLAQIEAGEAADVAALTTIHLQTVAQQVNLQLNKYDGMEANGQAEGLRGTADNILDIIDIVQGDANLNTAAGGNGNAGHIGGFAEAPGGLVGTVTHFQDNQAQTNFWAAFLSEANTINAHLTAIAAGHEQASSALVTQIQNYQQFGANFDAAQGPIFEARFDNELLNGTLLADTNAAVKGLTGILNGDKDAALAADHAMITAAGQGFAADAMDVSGNNAPIGGGTYVGTATTVATATSVNGLAQGTIPVTATPNIANGTGGSMSSPPVNSPPGGDNGGTPPGGPGGDPAAGGLKPGDLYFENMFNDATRILEGGLWHNSVPVGNQGHGTDGRYTADLQLVQTGLTADVAANDFAGVQLTDVNKVLGDLTTALGSVQGAVNNDAGAEAALRTAHLDIINTIENDPVLQALSIKDGNPGFNFAPAELATPLNANTPHATFAELGAIFNDAQSKSLGGINADNLPAIQADLQTVHDGLLTLMQDHPQMFQGATGIHASTIVDQINLQLTNFDHQYGFNPDAAKATNDNFLDITDIVAGDANLTNMASANGVTGWTGAPATDVVPVPYQDNADQANFWADFIASGNTLGAQAEKLVATGSAQDIKAFVHTLQGWEHNIQNFDAAQGGIFEARFDNELLGANSTVGADVTAMIKGLETHNAALVKAAADGFHANAADVSGNNVPLNGGTFNADGTTIADALSTATGPLPPAPVSLLTPAAPAAAPTVACAPPTAPAADHSVGADPTNGSGFANQQHHHHHFEMIWHHA